MPLVGIGGLENAVFHPAGHRDLLGEVLLGLHHRILDLVVGLHLDDHVLQAAIRFFALEDEIGVVAAHGARIGVDVLDEKVGLAVGQHSGEVNLLHTLLAQQIPEQPVLRAGVEAVGVEVEALGALLVLDLRVAHPHDLVLGRRHTVVTIRGQLDQIDLVLVLLLVLVKVEQQAEQARDDLVVEQLVEFVGDDHQLVSAFLGRVEQRLNLQRTTVEIAGNLSHQRHGREGTLHAAGGEVEGAAARRTRRIGGGQAILLRFDQAVFFDQLVPFLLAGSLGHQLLPWGRLLLSHLVELGLVDHQTILLQQLVDGSALEHLATHGEDAQIFIFEAPRAQCCDQGCPLGAHALGLEIQTGELGWLHAAPQGNRVINADVVGQVPVAQAVVWVGHGCLLSVWWNMGLAKFCQRTYAYAMSTMNISLPDTLKSFVDEQVSQRGYGTSSEYVRELIRKDQDRLQLRGLLLAGAASAPAVPADAGYFEGLRDRVRKAAAKA